MALYDSLTFYFETEEDKNTFELELKKYNLSLGNSKKFTTHQIISESVIFLSENWESTLAAVVAAFTAHKKYNSRKIRVTHPDHGEIELEGKIAEDYYKKHIANQSNKARD